MYIHVYTCIYHSLAHTHIHTHTYTHTHTPLILGDSIYHDYVMILGTCHTHPLCHGTVPNIKHMYMYTHGYIYMYIHVHACTLHTHTPHPWQQTQPPHSKFSPPTYCILLHSRHTPVHTCTCGITQVWVIFVASCTF